MAMQAKNCLVAVGILVTPLIIDCFFVREANNTNVSYSMHNNNIWSGNTVTFQQGYEISVRPSLNETLTTTLRASTITTNLKLDDTNGVLYAFLVPSVILLISSVTFAFFSVPCLSQIPELSVHSADNAIVHKITEDCKPIANYFKVMTTKVLNRLFIATLTFVVFLSMTTHACLIQFIPITAAQRFHYNIRQAALLSTAYNLGYTGNRLLSVPLSYIMSPVIMCAANLGITIIGSVLMILVALNKVSEAGLWAGCAIVGAGLSTLLPSGLVWASQVTGISAIFSAVVTIGLYVGINVGPTVVSIIFDNNHNVIFYLTLSDSILLTIAFVFMIFLARSLQERNKSSLSEQNRTF